MKTPVTPIQSTIMQVLSLNKDNITNFAFERNQLLKKAKPGWILFLDTDEKLSDSRDEILKQAQDDIFEGYRILRKNYFLGQYVGSEYILRLAKKNSGKWERQVHETWEVKGRIGKIGRPFIIHNTAKNLREYIAKINFYATLHAEANKKEGKKSNLFKITFYPVGKFIETLIKSRNITFSIMQALHSFLSWSKLYFLQH